MITSWPRAAAARPRRRPAHRASRGGCRRSPHRPAGPSRSSRPGGAPAAARSPACFWARAAVTTVDLRGFAELAVAARSRSACPRGFAMLQDQLSCSLAHQVAARRCRWRRRCARGSSCATLSSAPCVFAAISVFDRASHLVEARRSPACRPARAIGLELARGWSCRRRRRPPAVPSTRWISTPQRSTWPRKRSPRPAPSWAPSIRPGMSASTNSRLVDCAPRRAGDAGW